MPQIPFFQIDAFASRPFEGNQACVMPLENFLPDEVLQAIAAENNVAETAFIVQTADDTWDLRWFTPAVEVALCGHATLAAAHVLRSHLGMVRDAMNFDTVKSGRLIVRDMSDGRLEMDFPSAPITSVDVSDDIASALGARPAEAWAGIYYAVRFETPDDVVALSPDIRSLAEPGCVGENSDRGNFGCFALGGEGVDVTSRFFAPGSGIDEDPATGSWHTMLARIMSERFGRNSLDCFQTFPGRGARIQTRFENDRAKLIGSAVTVIEGRFSL